MEEAKNKTVKTGNESEEESDLDIEFTTAVMHAMEAAMS